ncbi:hypothetical protein [Salinimicrobium terrae]|uniref:hypothetical protein n=1 Tax=Salinimicrobium terrae TaxID=470866 RepID=UPI00041A5D2F|nr:hypothetical protein [Salinimicrobium terrae]
MKTVTEINSYDSVPRKGVSWRAIFAGVVAIISVMLLLNLIGLAVGFGSIEPTEESNPLSGLGTGALIWWIVSCLVALFIGGYVAARVGVSFSNKSGMIQGIMTWALYTFISAWLLTSTVGSIISGVGNIVSSAVSSTGQAIENVVTGSSSDQAQNQQQSQSLNISLEQAKQEFYALLEDTGKEELDPDRIESQAQEVTSEAREQGQEVVTQPGSLNNQIEQIFNNAKNEFEGTFEEVDKQALVNVLTERTDMSESEARQAVDNYLAQYDNLRQQAEEFLANTKEQANKTAESVAQGVSDAAMYLAIALILGVITAAAGGYLGAKNLRNDYARHNYFREDYEDDDDRRRGRNYKDDHRDEVH